MSVETDVVDAQIEAYRARDIDRFLSYYADDVSVMTFDGTVIADGKAAMRELYGKLFADSPDVHVDIASRITLGEFVIDEEHFSGFQVDDTPADRVAICVYRIEDGMIARLMMLR